MTILATRWLTRSGAESRRAGQDAAVVLGGRLNELLREQLGATYHVGVSLHEAGGPGGPGYLTVAFDSAPEMRERLVAVVDREIARLTAEPPSAQEIADLREAYRQKWDAESSTDEFWLEMLELALRRGENLEHISELQQRFERLTPKSFRKAARRWLRPKERLVIWSVPIEAASERH